jgi:hypothetical protein
MDLETSGKEGYRKKTRQEQLQQVISSEILLATKTRVPEQRGISKGVQWPDPLPLVFLVIS